MRLISAALAALLLLTSRAFATPAIDGIGAFNACGGGSPLQISTTLTTSNTNDAIFVVLTMGNTPVWVSTVTDTAGLNWHRRYQTQALNITADRAEEWWAPASAALTGDTITVTFTGTGGSNCVKIMAYGVSGAAWPVPFDPYYGQPWASNTTINQTITTQGTDDLLIAHYTIQSCTPTAGAGWTQIYSITGSDLIESLQVTSAQSGAAAPFGGSCPSTQMQFLEAMVSSAGLGTVQQSSKLNTYAILQTGMGVSKLNNYAVLMPGVGASKLNLYAILSSPSIAGAAPSGSGLGLLHSFPP